MAGTPPPPPHPTRPTVKRDSRPTATRIVFLDFDGGEVAGTGWNTGKTPIGSALYSGYDNDGTPGSFSNAEHAWMQEVWRQVAETYAPFDVDVTTEDKGAAARLRSTSADVSYGTQVLFTNSTQAAAQACSSTCLGVAWVGTFSDIDPAGYYQPAWIFTRTTTSATIAAQGASHEAGHTLGLHHDGLNADSYFPGTQAWGPIMGSAYSRAVSQFSKGEYTGANQKEDDFAVINSNGLPLRTDDHGNTVTTADALGAKASYGVSGVVSGRGDADMFAISLPCTRDLTVNASGIGRQSALDLRLDVINSAGRTVATSGPAASYAGRPPLSSGMNASTTVKGARGTYYLRVDGVGHGSPSGSGWSDYGSLGQYRVSATGCTSTTATTPSPQQGTTVTRPGAPRIGTAAPGARGGRSTALARWAAPTTNGGASITKYKVLARKLDANGRVLRTYGSAYQKPTARSLAMPLPQGRYRFVVVAYNRVGVSPASRVSNIVRAR